MINLLFKINTSSAFSIQFVQLNKTRKNSFRNVVQIYLEIFNTFWIHISSIHTQIFNKIPFFFSSSHSLLFLMILKSDLHEDIGLCAMRPYAGVELSHMLVCGLYICVRNATLSFCACIKCKFILSQHWISFQIVLTNTKLKNSISSKSTCELINCRHPILKYEIKNHD